MIRKNPIPLRLRALFTYVMLPHYRNDLPDGAWFANLEAVAEDFIKGNNIRFADANSAVHQFLKIADEFAIKRLTVSQSVNSGYTAGYNAAADFANLLLLEIKSNVQSIRVELDGHQLPNVLKKTYHELIELEGRLANLSSWTPGAGRATPSGSSGESPNESAASFQGGDRNNNGAPD